MNLSGEDGKNHPDSQQEEPELIPAAPLDSLNYYLTGGESGLSLPQRLLSILKAHWLPIVLLVAVIIGGSGIFSIYGINAAIQYLVVNYAMVRRTSNVNAIIATHDFIVFNDSAVPKKLNA